MERRLNATCPTCPDPRGVLNTISARPRRLLGGGFLVAAAAGAMLLAPGVLFARAAGQPEPGSREAEPEALVLVSLTPVREFNGDGRSIDLVLNVRRILPVTAEDAGGPRTVDDMRERLQPNTRERAEARDRARQAAAEAAAAAPLPEIRLVLQTMDGARLGETGVVEPGEFDLSVLMPDVWTLREVAWLQPVAGDTAMGTPLVVQPMLGRAVPIPEEAVSPAGIRYTRIAGWVGEDDAWDAMLASLRGRTWPPVEPDAPEEATPPDAADAPRGGGAGQLTDDSTVVPAAGATRAAAREQVERATPPPAAPLQPRTAPVFTGYRIYPDAVVVMDTEYGEIVVALRPDAAPNTAWNFRQLAAGGFYRQTVFHRIVPMTPAGDPFVIQGGDPSGEGAGGPGWWLPMERSPLLHDFGVISMARDVHPDSAGSQFFICLSRAGTARLDGSYTAFGRVIEGGDVVRRIAQVPLADATEGRPRQPPLIRDARLVPAPPRVLAAPGAGMDAGDLRGSGGDGNRVPR